MNGDVIGVETETALLVNEEIHDLLALVALELDHLAGLFIIDLVAIASEFLPEEGENLAGVKFSRKTSNRGQRLATISLLNTNMDMVLDLFDITGVVVGFGEGVEGLEIFDGHKLGCSGVSRGKRESLGEARLMNRRLRKATVSEVFWFLVMRDREKKGRRGEGLSAFCVFFYAVTRRAF